MEEGVMEEREKRGREGGQKVRDVKIMPVKNAYYFMLLWTYAQRLCC